VTCRSPIDAAVLTDYWLGALPGDEEQSVEEHLFGCDECGARLRDAMELVDGVRRLASGGNTQMVVSDAYLRRAAEAGLRIREYSVAPGGSVPCTVTEDDDLIIGRLAADVTGRGRVDISLCDGGGVEIARLQDIPVRAGSGSVNWQASAAFLKAAPSMTLIARLLAFDAAGAETLLGEYTFQHTRSLPGPGAW
jgi:hypothetical protein